MISECCDVQRTTTEHEASRRLKTEWLVQFDGMSASTRGAQQAASGSNDRGGGGGSDDDDPSRRVVVVGATNRPGDLDEAVRRRLTKRIYVPLPDAETRLAVLRALIGGSGGGGGRGSKSGGGGGLFGTGSSTGGGGNTTTLSSSSSATAAPVRLSSADLARVVAATDGYSASDLTALAKEAAMAPLRELSDAALQQVRAEELRAVRLTDFAEALKVVRPSVASSELAKYEAFTRDFGVAAG